MKRIYFIPIALIGCVSSVFAQRQISGIVQDEKGNTIKNARVTNLKTSIIALTDSLGYFIINVNKGDILEFTINNRFKKITIDKQKSLSIVLPGKISEIEEVVVIGYGNQKKSDVTGAIGTVKNEDFNQGLIANPGGLLQGKVAGVNISSKSGLPGGGSDIIIRGIGSFRSGTTALYVVDGFVIDNSQGSIGNNPMNFISPQDIQSIEVLKDASAAGIYGARGSNGVIVITTKKGRKGKTEINFSSSLTVSNLANKIDVFGADEFREQVMNIGGKLDDGGSSTDWQKELTRTGISNDINFSLAGGVNNTSYYASIGYEGQEGILAKSDLKRYKSRVSISQKAFNERLSIDFNLTAAKTKNNTLDARYTVFNMLTLNPTYPAYTNGSPTPVFNNSTFNPLIRQNIYDQVSNGNRILSNISPSFEIIKGLTYKLNLGVDYSYSNGYNQTIPNALFLEKGRISISLVNNDNLLVENYLTYKFRKKKHDFNFMVGHSYQEFYYETKGWSNTGFPNNGIEPRFQLSAAEKYSYSISSAYRNKLQSFFGRLNYGFLDKYILTATMRADGSSKFGKNNRYGYFPSLAGAWNISKENFLVDSKLISNLKLRGSWGKTGNQEIPAKITKSSYKSSVEGNAIYPLDNTDNYPTGIVLVRNNNPNLQWEVTAQTNFGIDFGIFNNRLTGTIDYFKKKSDNILLETATTDPVKPTPNFWSNIPGLTINNTGLEFTLNFSSDKTRDFSYNIGGNTSFIRNRVRNSPFKVMTAGMEQTSVSVTGVPSAGGTVNGYINNQPIGTFYMKEFLGIDQNGNSIFRDVNGDGMITDEDRVSAGSALPNFTYNFYLKFIYKFFDLELNFNGVSGNMIYNNNASVLFTKRRLSLSNNTTAQAISYPNENIEDVNTISTRYLENGSFLRLNNVTLGFNLDPKSLGFDGFVKNIRLSLTGQNLFVITRYSGFDPEMNSGIILGSLQTFGIDFSTYPRARSFMFGINATF